MVKSNPDLLDRLNVIEMMVTDTQKSTDAWCSRAMDDADKLTRENVDLKSALVHQDDELGVCMAKLGERK